MGIGLGLPLISQSMRTVLPGLTQTPTPTSSETKGLSSWESQNPGAGTALWSGKEIRGGSKKKKVIERERESQINNRCHFTYTSIYV